MDLEFFQRVFNSCLTIDQLEITLQWSQSISYGVKAELQKMHDDRLNFIQTVGNKVDRLTQLNTLHPDYQLDN